MTMNDCIEWGGLTNDRGYGLVRIDGRRVRVHRLAWERVYGPIPDGMSILHRCDNPPCHNVDHLFLGTQAENVIDMDSKGRRGTRLGITQPGTPGESHPRHKLTDADVLDIRDQYANGATQVALARQYGVAQKSISRIVRREAWPHL